MSGAKLVDDADRRCQEYYQNQSNRYLQLLAPSPVLDTCLHDFLDQCPGGRYTTRNRTVRLAAAQFWWEAGNVEEAELSSLALASVLHFDVAISLELLDHLAAHHPNLLRWAIRYSKLLRTPIHRHGGI